VIALLVAFVLAVTMCGPSQAASDAAIDANVAALFIGEEKTVEGTVTAAEREGNAVRLHLGSGPQALTVSLVIGLLSKFPPAPERYYLGKTLRVAGTIGSFRGTPEIVVRDAAEIQVAGAPKPAASNPPGTGPASARQPPPADTIEVLHERIRVLEERVRQLERSAPAGEDR
jgi:hypothetical protein